MHLESPGDLVKAGHDEQAPYSVQACDQSSHAAREDRMGSAGTKDSAMVLQNPLNEIFHRTLAQTYSSYRQSSQQRYSSSRQTGAGAPKKRAEVLLQLLETLSQYK